MYKLTIPILLSISINLIYVEALFSAPFFEEDFEDGLPAVSTGNPVWTLTPIFETLSGQGNNFELTSSSCHSGNNSLRVNYRGRNSFCNTCGTYATTQLAGHDNVDYLITAEDLTAIEKPSTTKANDGPAAAPGRVVFNKTNGFSTWEITEVVSDGGINNRLNLKLLQAGINNETPEFNSDDNIAIARMCGVDGHIGGDIVRRNDCDAGIVWFGDVVAAHQGGGDSVWRRMYLKSELLTDGIHQKLHYWRTDNKSQNASGNNVYIGSVILLADSRSGRPLEPQLSGMQQLGGAVYKPVLNNFPPIVFERSKWFYIEEEYKAATSSGIDPDTGLTIYNPDGEYRLWLSEAGVDTGSTPPILNLSNLTMAPLRDRTFSNGPNTSFWGNIQHNVHALGHWYIDDMFITGDNADLITDGNGYLRIGPVVGNCSDLAAPKSPIVSD